MNMLHGHSFFIILMHIPQGLYSLRKHRLVDIGIPITNLRRSSDRLRFVMGIPIPTRQRLLVNKGLCLLYCG